MLILMIFLFNIHQKYSFIYMYLVKRHNKILKTGVFYQTLKIDSLPYHLNNNPAPYSDIEVLFHLSLNLNMIILRAGHNVI